jgi:ABC-type sugar transport system permease subunit
LEGKVETKRNLFIFLAPVLIFTIVFIAYPVLYSAYLSLTHYNYATDPAPRFIGFQGYIDTFQDPLFHIALVNQAKFGIPYFILTFVFSLGIAVLINELTRGLTFFQVLFSLPVIIPLSLAGIIFEWMLFPDFGIFNHLLRVLGINPWNIKWYSDPQTAIYCLAIAQAWKMVGFTVLIFVAGLQTIPKTFREAGRIDGANFLQELWYIVIPNLKPYLFISTTWILINSLKVFDLPRVITEGGPGTSTVTLYFYSWKLGFEQLLMGRASQVAYITAAIILLFSWGLNRLFRHEPAERG